MDKQWSKTEKFVSEADLVCSIKHVVLSTIKERFPRLRVHVGYPVMRPAETTMRTRKLTDGLVVATDRAGRKHMLMNPTIL